MRYNQVFGSKVLLVRPPVDPADPVAQGLRARGFAVVHVPTAHEAVAELVACEYPLVLFELTSSARSRRVSVPPRGDSVDVPETPLNDGLAALRSIRQASPASQVVVLVKDNVDLGTCCQAVMFGAASFVEWQAGQPIEPILDRLQQANTRYQITLRDNEELQNREIFDETGLAGQSQIMAKLLFMAKRAAIISDVPVLIGGESGTGKQLLAEAIHRMDPKRRNKPFLTVNCAAITGSLAESALFGHRKGAFTGATENRLGYFQAANGGTILLDEISEMEMFLQPKLLRVLQERKVLPVGADEETEVDVRIIAACNRPLEILVEKNEFRLDLYQRLNVINLNMPPLRERPEDIPLLVQFFLKRYQNDYPQGIESVDERVYEVLAHTIGSGNVRELENAIRQILVFKRAGNRIELSDIPPDLLKRLSAHRKESQVAESLTTAVESLMSSGRMCLGDMLYEFEGLVLREALTRSKISHTELANQLGLSRRTLYNKLDKHDLSNPG